jgi:hypothetical protein
MKHFLEHGAISRENLDWESGLLHNNWLALRPLLDVWVQKQVQLDSWQAEIVRGLIDYEAHRLHFVSGDRATINDALTRGENWIAFASTVNLVEALARVRSHEQLTPELLKASIIVLVYRGQASFEAYTVESSLLSQLVQHQPDLVSIFN